MLSSATFTFKHVIDTDASPEALWRLYSDVATWPSWDDAVERVTLDGPFEAGAAGAFKLRGQDALAFRLLEVEPERGFTDETAIPGGVVRFRHTIEPLAGGGARIEHAVDIEGPADLGEQLGAKLTAGVPRTMARIAALALEETS